MKKTMITLAATFAAAVSMAAVTSQVVGYQTVAPREDGMAQVGVCFMAIGSQDGSYVIDSTKFLSSTPENGDMFLLLDTAYGEFETYYFNGADWLFTSSQGDIDGQVVGSIVAKPGDAIYSITASNLTIAGEIPAGAQTVVFDPANDLNGGGLLPFANPFPVATKFADLTFAENGDSIITLDPAYGEFQTYYFNGTDWLFTSSQGDVDGLVMDGQDVLLSASACGYLVPGGVRTWVVPSPVL